MCLRSSRLAYIIFLKSWMMQKRWHDDHTFILSQMGHQAMSSAYEP